MASKKQRFVSDKVAENPHGHWSNTLRVGDFIWLSGFTARENDMETIRGVGDPYEQAKMIFTKIKHCLEAAGSAMADVTTMTIYVTNMAHNKEVWRARKGLGAGLRPQIDSSLIIGRIRAGLKNFLSRLQVWSAGRKDVQRPVPTSDSALIRRSRR